MTIISFLSQEYQKYHQLGSAFIFNFDVSNLTFRCFIKMD